jgi:hypothetical protein
VGIWRSLWIEYCWFFIGVLGEVRWGFGVNFGLNSAALYRYSWERVTWEFAVIFGLCTVGYVVVHCVECRWECGVVFGLDTPGYEKVIF